MKQKLNIYHQYFQYQFWSNKSISRPKYNIKPKIIINVDQE